MPPPSSLPEHCSVLWLFLVMRKCWDLSLAAELPKAGNSAKTQESETCPHPPLEQLRGICLLKEGEVGRDMGNETLESIRNRAAADGCWALPAPSRCYQGVLPFHLQSHPSLPLLTAGTEEPFACRIPKLFGSYTNNFIFNERFHQVVHKAFVPMYCCRKRESTSHGSP